VFTVVYLRVNPPRIGSSEQIFFRFPSVAEDAGFVLLQAGNAAALIQLVLSDVRFQTNSRCGGDDFAPDRRRGTRRRVSKVNDKVVLADVIG